MSESSETTGYSENLIGRALLNCSYVFALAGGAVMVGLTIMTVVSVAGRYLFSAPIFGDFEMVAMGTAVAVFLFLPYCHMNSGNVIIDLFLAWAPKRIQSFFDVVGALILGSIAGLLTWRMAVGGIDLYRGNDATYILALPLWWAFPSGVLGMGLLTLCCFYTAFEDLKRTLR